jgi:hypothetical protein
MDLGWKGVDVHHCLELVVSAEYEA